MVKSKDQRRVVLIRNVSEDRQELGNLYVYDGNGKELFRCKTLERGWLNNRQNESCVPPGKYPIELEWSPRFKMNLWELKDVPNRSECKIHVSNFWKQLNGCIAPGDMHIDLNGDQYRDVRNSRKTLDRLHSAMGSAKSSTMYIVELSKN